MDIPGELKVDLAYALDFLDRINAAAQEHPAVRDRYMEGHYSIWATKQFYLLSRIKDFSKYKKFDAYSRQKESLIEETLPSIWRRVGRSMWMVFVSVVSLTYFAVSKPRMFLYETDRLARESRYGERLFTVMDELNLHGVAYALFIHTSPDVPVCKNFFTRRRPVLYLETIDLIHKFFYGKEAQTRSTAFTKEFLYDNFTPDERACIEKILPGFIVYLEQVQFRTKLLTRLLKWFVPQTAGRKTCYLSIDDMRFVDEFCFASKTNGVTSYVFQHSNFDYLMGQDRLSPSDYMFPDTFLVWNEYWKNKIVRLSPVYAHNKERLAIGGRAYNYKFTAYERTKTDKKDSILNVVIPYEVALTESQIRPYIDAMYQDGRIVMKLVLRGDFDRDLQIKKYFTDEMLASGRALPIEPKDKFTTIAGADLVLGVYSGFLDEVAESLIPVGIPKTDYVTMSSLLDDNVADEIQLGNTPIYDQLVKVRDMDPEILQHRKELLTKNTGDARVTVQKILREHGIL